MQSDTITAQVDEKVIVKIQNADLANGMAGLGSGLNQAWFDNFTVKPLE